jgi:hypothetical protein
MSGSISFNPSLTTNVQNSFLLETQGYIQGFAMDDPSARMELSGGVLASTETLTMWGGVPITELVNVTGTGADGLGPLLKRATVASGTGAPSGAGETTAWSTFNQAHSMLITPGGLVPPQSAAGQYVAFFRVGTNIRLAVACAAALVTAAAAGVNVGQLALLWDTVAMNITSTSSGNTIALPASTRLLSVNTNSKIITPGTPPVWASGDAAIILI